MTNRMSALEALTESLVVSYSTVEDVLDGIEGVDGQHLPIVIGQLPNHEMVYEDLAEMPHMLVAGATGSGKSVFLNVMLGSLLSWATPKDLRLVLVDPKQVEFAPYNEVPHLLFPIITDSAYVPVALQWLGMEMERRYTELTEHSVRHIGALHLLGQEMPFIVVVIDELADLMMGIHAEEIEQCIVRLAQKSRAVGIHLVLATQRPSVNVVTGLIKANVPTRVAFALPSQIDSRTILDQAGAETLRGKGDMLYRPAGSAPIHMQGAFISDDVLQEIINGT